MSGRFVFGRRLQEGVMIEVNGGGTAEFGAVEHVAGGARSAAFEMARATGAQKNAALHRMASLLEDHQEEIYTANRNDLSRAEQAGLTREKLARLVFDKSKLFGRVRSLMKIAALPDPVGVLERAGRMDNGVTFARMRVPLGVILMIYEARPHVTVNAGAFALKSGNAIILKGGSEAAEVSAALKKLWARALQVAGLPGDAVQVVSFSHEEVGHLLTRPDLIDLVIPRGGKELIRAVAERSRVPVIKHFEGNCHVYVGERADVAKARRIILDSKLLMPGVCNAAESLLLDRSMAAWLPELAGVLKDNGIEVRGCEETVQAAPWVKSATEEDYRTEYLDKIYSLRVVDGLDAAIEHINRYGSGHTDAIVTDNQSHARRFLREVDSSVVLVNASTMFCDGESLGMGAEIGISTDKLHARGPMGLRELTSYKFVLIGDGQIMGGD
jgi:glutamate-5-semialdehyde dehydrogenase